MSESQRQGQNLESSKRKMACHLQRIAMGLTADLEKMEARRQWDNMFEVLNEKKMSRILYPAKLFCCNEGEIKT